MVIFGLVILNILILNIRLWITRGLWKDSSRLRMGIIMGVIAGISLFFYPEILNHFELSQYRTGQASINLNPYSLVLLFGYLILVLIINSIISGKLNDIGKLLAHTVFFLILITICYFVFGNIPLSSAAIYYLLVAGSEEFLKYLSSRKLQDSQGYASSDIIVYALIVALGFAFFENIIYLLEAINHQTGRRDQLTSGSTVLFTRGLIAFLVHLLFTGCIAVFSLTAYRKKNPAWLLAGIVLGVGLHLAYNLLLSANIGFMVLVYLIGGYAFLSWLLFKSERLYL